MAPSYLMFLGRTASTDPDTSDERVREGRKKFREELRVYLNGLHAH